MTAHAKYSPSSANRWLKCTASPRLEAGLPDTETPAARKGTLYHEVAEIMLRRLTAPAWELQLATKRDVETAFRKAFAYARRRGADDKLMDEQECRDLVVPYVVWIKENCGNAIGRSSKWGIEDRVHVSSISEKLYGTVDFWCYDKVENNLVVADLKTGRYAVDPVENNQAAIYTMGVLEKLDKALSGGLAVSLSNSYFSNSGTTVQVVIFQDGIAKSWSFEPDDLTEHYKEISSAIRESEFGATKEVPGEHCRWCRAKSKCRAFNAHGLALAQDEFSDPNRSLETMGPEEVARFLDLARQFEVFMGVAIETLTEKVYRGSLKVPGYKVIRGVKHKTWENKEEVKKKLGKKVTKEALLTPTQAEKALGADAVAGLWIKPVGDLKLVTEATRGKPVTGAAAIEFADETKPGKPGKTKGTK